MSLPVKETLRRQLSDNSKRRCIINEPTFPAKEIHRKKTYKSFNDGKVIHDLKITCPCILLSLYLDTFSANSHIGSSANNQKIMGVYYWPLSDLTVASKRSLIQTIALLYV